MRVTTKLQTISLFMIAVLVVLLPAVFWLLTKVTSASSEGKLADEIQSNFLERTMLRDEYFLYREKNTRKHWEESKQRSDQLLRQARLQFQDVISRDIIEALISDIEDTVAIFHRIVANSEVLKTATDNRQILEELDKRLSSQLLMKATSIRNATITLKDSTVQRVEQYYRQLLKMLLLLAGTLVLGTIFFSTSLIRLIRVRLNPLHEGTKTIGDGDLNCRITIGGADEFTELAHSINAMTDKLAVEIESRKSAEEEMRQAKAAADAANRTKSTFLANMSHELRTPLNAILGFSDILRRDVNISEPQNNSLAIIHKSADHLLSIINDLLDIAKIEAGSIMLEATTFDLGRLITDVIDMLRIHADEKGLQLLLDESSRFPRFIVADKARLRQIFINLLFNAIKATEQGGVTLRLGLKPDRPDHLFIEVEDTGCGIAPEDQARLMVPFVQVGPQSSQQGTGLGLAITRQFVELMGGNLSFTSTVGQGSTFRVEIPAQLAQPEDVLYNDEAARLEPGHAKLSAAEMFALPDDLRAKLERALTALDMKAIATSIAEIQLHHPILGEQLKRKADKLAYSDILHLLGLAKGFGSRREL